MCGIAGILAFEATSLDLDREVRRMTFLQKHRGPDGEGFFVGQQIALGHRRLSIIDLDSGKQPMSNEDDSIWITFNGEIYNYQVLRTELLELGHSFKTHSDTEVIIHGYEEWGPLILNRLRGMFAFAIFDKEKEKIFAARDPFGIKPFVYRVEDNYFAFASEINALKEVGGMLPSGNAEAIDMFLRYGYIPAPETIFREIRKLEPGCFIEVNYTGKLKITRYWDFDFTPDNGKTKDDWVKVLEQAIDDSVAAHTVADVPYGVFLSGGIDSTLIASSLKKFLGHASTAFCMGFKEKKFSELRFARQASEHIGHDLITGCMEDVSFEELKAIVNQYGEPFGDSSCIPTWKIAELVRKYVPLVLTGDGGDELFAGYAANYLNLLTFDPWLRIKKGFWEKNPRKVASGLKEIILTKRQNPFEKYVLQLARPNPSIRKSLWKKQWHYLTERPCLAIMNTSERCKQQPDFLSQIQKLDIVNYLPNDILVKVDVATMAHGLEARPPLIDTEIYDVGSKVPPAMNFSYRFGRVSGKKLFKAILTNKGFNKEFVYRSKKGFTVPKKLWFKSGGVANSFLKNIMTKGDHSFNQLFDKDGVLKILGEHEGGKNHDKTLWYVLIIALWMEQNDKVKFN